jgi:hypothetical protein
MTKTEFGFFLGIFLVLILAANVSAEIIYDNTWTNFTIEGNITNNAPGAIGNLIPDSKSTNSLNWKWDNPTDADFNGTIIFIDGVNVANLSGDKNSYNATGLSSDTLYTISIKTIDLGQNINNDAVERSDRTDKTVQKKKCAVSTSEYLKSDVVDSSQEESRTPIKPVDDGVVYISSGKNSQTKEGLSITAIQIVLIALIAVVLLMLVYSLLIRSR